jgi:hypothetical protein
MRSLETFLDAVLPDSGIYCVVGIQSDNKVRQQFVDTKDDVAERAGDLVEQEVNAYFAVASFREGSDKRTQDNAAWMKAFWLDLDCGPGKEYASQDDALAALPDFIHRANLPQPLLVNSGNGVHVYWPLHEQIDSESWLRIAGKLKAACRLLGLEADPAVTADSARILRIPSTVNFKDPENPKTVHIMGDQYEVTTADDIEENLDALDLPHEEPLSKREHGELSETAKALIGARTSKFKKIVRRSLKESGCNAIKHIVTNQDGLEEPLWRAGLSIAWACEDADEAIHLMSKKHSGYDPQATLEKAKQTKGPYTCETIGELMPSLCEGCPHKGKISSPIQLGSEVKRDDSGMFLFDEQPGSDSDSEEAPEKPQKDQSVQGFRPPFPYFRAEGGGVYRQEGSGDEAQEIKVYEYDLYPIKRVFDPNDGESIVFRLHLPQDGVKEFTVPLKRLMAGDQFRETFGGEGVAATQAQMKEIMNYTIKFTKELQKLQQAHEAQLQFGWTIDRDKFIVGNRAYTRDGSYEHNPASSTTADLIRHFEPQGDLREWKAAFNVFAREGMEPLQLTAGVGFAAPLMPFTGLSGATINLISNESGTGKSTAGYLAMSIFGDPKGTALIAEDTHLAKMHRIGVMNNLPVMSDEMTNLAPDLLSNMIYAVSQGRARHRMERDVNRERKNISSWKTILLTNSNASMMSKLAKAKARPDGEMMRLLEMHVSRVYVEGADILFDKINDHFGLAGEVYIPWLVKNRDEIPKLYDKQKEIIYNKIGKRMEERFWVSTMAADLVGLRIAQKLGLHDYDLVHLERWVCDYIVSLRGEVKSEVVLADDLVGEFLMDHSNSILAVGNRINPRSGDNIWMPSRSAKLVARFELDENRMYIAKKAFREYCVDRQFTESEALRQASDEESSFRYIKTVKKRMMAGTAITAPGVDAHVFECSPEEAEALFDALDNQRSQQDDAED